MFVVCLDRGYIGVSTMKTRSTKRVSCCEESFISFLYKSTIKIE